MRLGSTIRASCRERRRRRGKRAGARPGGAPTRRKFCRAGFAGRSTAFACRCHEGRSRMLTSYRVGNAGGALRACTIAPSSGVIPVHDDPCPHRQDDRAVRAGVQPAATTGARRAQRGGGRTRRPRLRPARLLRLRDRHARDRPPGRGRAALQPLPRDGAVLADPRLPSHRTQPSRRRHGLPHRHSDRLPGLRRPHPAVRGHAAAPPARRRLRHDRDRQVASGAALGAERGRAVRALAARARLRALLRLPERRHQPVDAGAGVRQPLHRAAAIARGRLPPDRGPGRPGHPRRAGPAPGGARQAVLPLLRDRRHARAAPGAERLDRALPRPLRRRLGSAARSGLRTPARARRRAARHDAARAPAMGGRVGLDSRRRIGGSSPARWRSSPASCHTPTTRSGGWSTSSPRSDASTTRSSWCSPTTARAPRADRSARSTSTASPTTWSTTSATRWRASTTSAASAPTTTTRGAGPGPATRRCACGSATPGSAECARR